jgi:hypothetical protein
MTNPNAPQTVEINGHGVPVHEAEKYFDGETGEPITDEQWDLSKAREAEFADDPDAVTWVELVREDGSPA